MSRRVAGLVVAPMLAATLVALLPSAASAHPLGNATVNRSVAVVVAPAAIDVRYTIDMAEVPAFVEIGAIDANHDGTLDAAERSAHAATACDQVRLALDLQVDGAPIPLAMAGDPRLEFPPGVGGLETLRLVCRFATDAFSIDDATEIAVADGTDDGRPGWREVTIAAGAGLRIAESSVPAVSPSAELTAYPDETLEAPPDVREGRARVGADAAASAAAEFDAETGPPSNRPAPADDPLVGLIAGELTPPLIALAFLVSAGLGAGHALTPGHGKTLVAAYLIGSRASLRQAAGLGLTVAAAHTAGVFLLGLVTLIAGEFLVPDRVVTWLSLAAGIIVIVLGAGLLWRAIRPVHGTEHGHAAGHDHEDHRHAPSTARPIRARGMVLLGLAGGLVPSTSALIVLLVAVTTGRILLGGALIIAFGLGMAAVMALVAVVVARIGPRIGTLESSAHPVVRRGMAAMPLVAGLVVLATGTALALQAALRIG
jgi:ABC-type nickel/cobalt efflux system permease component RcnA